MLHFLLAVVCAFLFLDCICNVRGIQIWASSRATACLLHSG